jgi:hypothetical protein
MLSKESPDFCNYNLKELKVIAFETPYENNISFRSRSKGKCNKSLILNPISLTLSKNRLVKALSERWGLLQSCRDKYYYTKPRDEDNNCPICYDSLIRSWWCDRKTEWLTTHKASTVTTPCKHDFCGDCWGKIHEKILGNNNTN